MTLKEHYKFHSRKSIKPYFRFLVLLILAFTAINTLGRYTNTGNNSGDFMTAKWSVSVNGESLSNSSNTLSNSMQLINSNDGTSYLGPGDECYFDITIDPSTTEAALAYTISIDLASGNNHLPSGSKIERYELYTGQALTLANTTSIDLTSTIIIGNIGLTNRQPLGNESIRKYRIYCSIPNDATILGTEEFNVYPVINIGQQI